ncbi:hypothetical protein BDR05DRAFT_871201, partial [Suillus weaverae]
LYSPPDTTLLQLSSQTVASCTHFDETVAVSINIILSVVTMIPHKSTLPLGVTED